MLHDRGGIRSSGDDVEVADSLPPTPKAARRIELADCRAFSQVSIDLCGDPRRLRVEHALSCDGLAPQQ